jgi:hypothetical protein
MKKNLILLLLIIMTVTISCRKNFSDEKFTPDSKPVIPDLSLKATAGINGFVVDENKNPLYNARVIAGDKETFTDGYGFFSITGATLNKAGGLIKVVATNYFTGYKTFTINEGKVTFIRMQLIPKTTTGTISGSTGGSITTVEGAKVELPADAAVVAGSSAAYTGNIKVAVKWIDPAATGNFQLTTPGDNRGLNNDGHLVYAKSYSSVAVELTGDAGQLLQIAMGKKATITLPVPAVIATTAPSSVALWYFDESNGFWKQESTAAKVGNNYIGQVSHFSFWSGATGYPLVNFNAQVLDASLQPLAHVPVMLTQAGMPPNAGYGKFEYTDANGYVSGLILGNSSLVLDVLTPCATPAYSIPFTTTTNDVNLGAVTGNAGQSLVVIKGTAVNCNNAPITNGYVQTYDNGFYNRIPVVNGNFSFTGLACTNTIASYVVIDEDTHQQNIPQTITLAAGMNNLGQLTACGTSTLSTITYTINGTTYILQEPANKIASYLDNTFNWTTIVDLNSSNTITLSFDGGITLSSAHKVSDIFCTSFTGGRASAPVPITVNITEYGLPGGFVSGNFSGTMFDFVSNAPYTVNFNFRVRRNF